MPTVRLQAYDGEPISVDVEIACCSQTIKTILSDRCDTMDGNEAIILEEVDRATLVKVIEWMTYHKNNPPPKEDDKNKQVRLAKIRAWDANFINVDAEMLDDLILAAKFLNIKGLLDFACYTLLKPKICKRLF